VAEAAVEVRIADEHLDEVVRRVAAAVAALNVATELIKKLRTEREHLLAVVELLTACPSCGDDPSDSEAEGCETCRPLREALADLHAFEDFGS
jgi:hypothetical protein